jgi:hypothetical protein
MFAALGFTDFMRCAHRWVDAGKFLTGFSAVGSIAIPAILYHAEVWCMCIPSASHAPVVNVRSVMEKMITQLDVDEALRVAHAQKIAGGALALELAAVAVSTCRMCSLCEANARSNACTMVVIGVV